MSQLQHDLIADLKRVKAELGRIPTRAEYLKLGKFGHRYEAHFGLWAQFVMAAGEVPARASTKGKEIKFDDIREVVGEFIESKPKREIICPSVSFTPSNFRCLVLGDIHFPWASMDALAMVYAIAEMIKPTHIVQIGDIADFFAYSKFPRTMNTYSPQAETELYYEMASTMWHKLKAIAKDAECYQLKGNHGDRAFKRMIEKAPELEHMVDFDKWFTFPGVNLVSDSRQELMINDIAFIHGYKTQLGAHRDHMLKNVVCGHSHLGGVSYRNMDGKILWELNAGYLGCADSKALSYTAQRSVKWTLGVGLVDDWGPRFIPF